MAAAETTTTPAATPSGTTERVSVATDGTEANDFSGSFAISSVGRHGAFSPPASNLAADDTNAAEGVFFRERGLS